MEKIKKHLGWHYLNEPKHLFLTLFLVLLGVFGFRYSLWAYSEIFAISLALEKSSGIFPDEPVVVNFSQAIFPGSLSDLAIEPKENIKTKWDADGKKLFIYPAFLWEVEKEYKVILPEVKSRLFVKGRQTEIKFSTLEYPKVASFSPKDQVKDITLDMEEPIVVGFSRPSGDFMVRVELDPTVPLIFQSSPEKNEARFLPKDKLREGIKYWVKVYLKHKKEPDENYRQVHVSSFETLPPPQEVWEKDHALRLEQAKKYTRAKKTLGKYMDVNLTQQIVSIFENGEILDSYIISSGKRGMETPKGEFSIHNKAPRVWSKKYGLYMPFWMAVASDGSFGFHELPEWPGGYKEGASHLGIPVSHGCMRLGVGAAKRVYDWAEIGTPVVIY